MNTLPTLYRRMIDALGVRFLEIPLTAVKFFRQEEELPESLTDYAPDSMTLTGCQACRQASLGDVVLLTRENIGCIAAAITFGLVDQEETQPLRGSRLYTEIMKERSGPDREFIAPSPRDFTDGTVYACRESGRSDFSLFGKEDSGRFCSREVARKAIQEMTAIQPAIMKAVFFYSTEFDDLELIPDVVVLDVRPVELTRLVQAYQYNSGKRVTGSMGPVRVVNSDLIVRPYLTGEINFSSYCIGARLIAEYDPNRLGMGMPFLLFREVVQGLEDSKTGYPFPLYPGASPAEPGGAVFPRR